MAKPKHEYDSALGGSVQLPTALNTYKYAADRLDEIKSMVDAITHPTHTKLVFQTLPKHMRRRAMSHNPKRLPRKFRKSHISQMTKSGTPAKLKRPSRKYRRKTTNLMREYVRRQRKNIWLETHIWHAKRFHMTELWGYKLPLKSCDKTYRSNYRASAQHCLIQDISYMGCIELSGPLDIIRDKFEKLRNPNSGLGICAKAFTTGKREGFMDLFKIESYPLNALGPISFLWKPIDDTDIDQGCIRTVWITVHPSFFYDVVAELVNVFQLKCYEDDNNSNELPTTANNEQATQKCLAIFFNIINRIKLVQLKDNLNRFRLTGPLSHAVLSKAFQCHSITNTTKAGHTNWFTDNLKNNPIANEAHHIQSGYWSSLSNVTSPAELCSNMILALNIVDPRVIRPKRRTKALPDQTFNVNAMGLNDAVCEIPLNNSVSQIWDKDCRERIFQEKMTTSDYCVMRNKHALVPGEKCLFENDLQPVPVLLIQRPGSKNNEFKRLGYGCGWDVIVPAGYGISTWICLIMWGAKAGGLREIDSICRESGFDQFLPDTLPSNVISEQKSKDLRERYFKLPPNKRPNYTKLSIVSPFKCPWSQLIFDWTSPPSSTYFVVRDRIALETISKFLQKSSCQKAAVNQLNLPDSCLIPIHILMDTRGHTTDFSIICLPKRVDFKQYYVNRQMHDNQPVYMEPLKIDANEKIRKQLRKNHLALLKRLRGRRVRIKRRKQEHAEKRVLIAKPGTAKIVTVQRQRIRELWLPEVPKNVRHQCSRETIGYLSSSDFSFVEATVAGVGYVTYAGLMKICKLNQKQKKGNMILVRGTTTRQFRFGSIMVNI